MIRVNEDKEYAKSIMDKLKDNKKKYGKRYCPCVISKLYEGENSDDYVCMCKEFREQENGWCHCHLYFKS